jgi:hypothetical protein
LASNTRVCVQIALVASAKVFWFAVRKYLNYIPVFATVVNRDHDGFESLTAVVTIKYRFTNLELGLVSRKEFHSYGLLFCGALLASTLSFHRSHSLTLRHRCCGVAVGGTESLTAATSSIKSELSTVFGLSVQNAPIAQ